MRNNFVFTLLLTAVLFSACEEQMVIIPEFVDECSDKVILIEELTGVSCPNCPRGAAVLQEILDLYPGKVVAYSVHGDFLAEPKSNSKFDFRSVQGKEIEDFLRPWRGKPAATVDRMPFPDLLETGFTNDNINEWLTMVENRCRTPKTLDVQITSDYDETTRIANIAITTTGVIPTEQQLLLNVVITESHIIDVQDAGSDGIIEEYEHNHAMRAKLSQLRGDALTNQLDIDQSITRNYTYTVPDDSNGEYIAENMEVVAYITEGGQDKGPVVQAAQAHLD